MSKDLAGQLTGKPPWAREDGKNWKQGWSGNDGIAGGGSDRYDERFDWGKMLAATGAVLWMIGVVVYIALGSSGDNGSFDRAVNEISGAVWGGAIFGFGSFVMLLGVIFMAGAERIDH